MDSKREKVILVIKEGNVYYIKVREMDPNSRYPQELYLTDRDLRAEFVDIRTDHVLYEIKLPVSTHVN